MNHIKWTLCAHTSNALLYNENHRFTYMQEKSEFVKAHQQLLKGKEILSGTTTGAMFTAVQVAMQEAVGIINTQNVWLECFVDSGKPISAHLVIQTCWPDTDYIQNHPDCSLIKEHIVENHILATWEDNNNDMFYTILNILLCTLSKEQHICYMHAAINKLDPTNKIKRLLKDKSMVFALLKLCIPLWPFPVMQQLGNWAEHAHHHKLVFKICRGTSLYNSL